MPDTEDVTMALAGIIPGDALSGIVAGRADIMALTQQTHDAALMPGEPGGLSHAERAAFACRIARLNGDHAFEAHFMAILEKADAGDTAFAADPGFDGGDDQRLRALVRHVDLVARAPKDATRNDIDLLRQVGIAEPDIVRLAELIAFVSYQIRVAAGLRLMRGLA